MNAPVQIEGAVYRPDGSAIVRLGQLARLDLQILGPTGSGPMVPQDLDGRHFVQRILDRAGNPLVEVEASHPDATTVRFELAVTEDLLPADAKAADLTHVLIELLDGDEEDDIVARPFSVRRLRAGAPDAQLNIGPPDRFAVRYVGAPGASAAQQVRDAGLIGQATGDALAAWLRQPALDAAAAAGAIVLEWQGLMPEAQTIYATAQQVAADREQTGQDRQAVAADRQQTGEDREQTGQDRIATGQDRVVTGQDRGVTTTDRIATQLARDLAQQYAGDAATVSGVFVPIYASRASATGAETNVMVDRLYLGGYATPNDGGGGYYKRSAVNPSRPYTSFQDAFGDWWELDEDRPNSLQYGITSARTAAETAARAQAMIDENGGKTLDWVAGGGVWTSNRIFIRNLVPNEKLIINIDPGLKITGAPGAASVVYISRTNNIKMVSKGAEIDGPPAIVSHTLYLEGSDDCDFEGIIFKGGGSGGGGKDAAYLGGGDATGTDPCRRITFTECSFLNGRRNGLSIVEAFGVYCYRCLFAFATGAPGAGCDVEANRHGTVGEVRFFDSQFNDNQNNGLVVVFGDDVKAYRCSARRNGLQGFLSGAGGMQFNETVYRPGYDRVSVTAIDTATGWITVTDTSQMVIGHILSTSVRNGYVLPAELPAGYYFVFEISGNQIRVSNNGRTPITAFSSAGSGGTSFTTNPFTSNLSFSMFTEGQSSRIYLEDFVASDNGGSSEIGVATSVDVHVNRGEAKVKGSARRALSFSLTRDVQNEGFEGVSDGTTGPSPVVSYGTCSYVHEAVLKARGAPGGGVAAGPVFDYRSDGTRLFNCGNASYGCFQLSNMAAAKVRNLSLVNDAGHPAVNGVVLPTTVTDTVFEDLEMRGPIGTSNTSSISDVGARNRFIRCRQFDGGYRGEGSKTHDFPSIPANSYGTATTVVVSGAKVGEPFVASLGIYYAGLFLHAVCNVANVVTVTPQNTTTSAIDPASTTLSVRSV